MNDKIDKQKYIFSRMFLLANKLQTLGDRMLSGEMTIRQWLLTAAVAQYGEVPPTLGEVARLLGNSHQNVKQMAVKLQEKGFLLLVKSESDYRETRLRLTKKNCCFWEKSRTELKSFLDEIFCDFCEEEMDLLYQSFNKLYEGIKRQEIK